MVYLLVRDDGIFITFSTEDKEHWMRIQEEDMDLIIFAVATITGEFIDTYADDKREFGYEQWNEILDEIKDDSVWILSRRCA